MSKIDQIEKLPCGSIIQHGPHNDRIYLLKISPEASSELPERLIDLAEVAGYTKIFAKIPEHHEENFTGKGFKVEASVPGFYNGDTGLFLGYYLNKERSYEDDVNAYGKNMILAFDKKDGEIPPLDTKRFRIRQCNKDDARRMSEIYRIVFHSYPFPIYDPGYIMETMNSHIDYFCVETRRKRIAAIASAEKDMTASNAEMTDFATLPEWRGNGFGVHLLKRMEEEVKKQGIKIAYTIARAASPGMNITFSKLGYSFGGRLKNNTNISGKVESMNVWYKKL